jgi:uncharacterized protein
MRENAPRPTDFANGCRPRPAGRSSAPDGPRGVTGCPSDEPAVHTVGREDPVAPDVRGFATLIGQRPIRSHRRVVYPGHKTRRAVHRARRGARRLRREPAGRPGRRPQPAAAPDTGSGARDGAQPGRGGLPGKRRPRRVLVGTPRASPVHRGGHAPGPGPERAECPGRGRMTTDTNPGPALTRERPGAPPRQGETARSRGLTRAIVSTIRGYQLARSGRPTGCRFTPSCSSYAIEAIERRGVWSGSGLALRRLLRCRPWGGSGLDPVPERRGR